MATSSKSQSKTSSLPTNDIITGDCIATMNALPENSVDLVFADPPYNIGFEYDGHYVDERPDDQYITWTQDWISAATRLMKPSGSLYVLIGDEYAAETRLHLKSLQKEGKLLFRNWIAVALHLWPTLQNKVQSQPCASFLLRGIRCRESQNRQSPQQYHPENSPSPSTTTQCR